MTTKTKVQVEEENMQLLELIAKQQKAMEQMDERMKDLERDVQGRHKKVVLKDDPDSVIKRDDKPDPGGGWIVTAPRSDFEGVTCGVPFKNGIGIVDVELPDSEQKAHLLEQSYGYDVKAMSAQELSDYHKFLRTGTMPGEEGKKVTTAEALIR